MEPRPRLSFALLRGNDTRYSQYTRGEPWFDDGNIVLLSSDTSKASHVVFKLHRGVLGRQSEVFQSMFNIPQPALSSLNDQEVYEGCQVVQMFGDDPSLLSDFFSAIYDGGKFRSRNIEDFFHLSGVLQLAHKYIAHSLRTEAIRHLTKTWSFTLQGLDDMVQNAIQTPLQGDSLSYPYVHPIHVYHLASQVQARILLPSTMYFLSLYPFKDLLDADHPKLLALPDHPARPSSILTADEVQIYTLVFQHRINLILSFIKSCENTPPSLFCITPEACQKGHRRLGVRLNRSWVIRTALLQFMSQAVSEMEMDTTVCSGCRKAFRQSVARQREDVWNELPVLMGLPPWEELMEELEEPSGEGL